jgi:hypothetical protein
MLEACTAALSTVLGVSRILSGQRYTDTSDVVLRISPPVRLCPSSSKARRRLLAELFDLLCVFAIGRCVVSTGHDDMEDTRVFPVSPRGQRNGSRVPTSSCAASIFCGGRMTTRVQHRSRKALRYSLEEFKAAYNLPDDEAARLFQRFGPSIRELDTLMRAKTMRGNISLDNAPTSSDGSSRSGK